MAVGTAFIYSASFANDSARTLVWFKQLYVKQMIWYGLGITFAIVLCILDYRPLARWSIIGYWDRFFSLVLVLIHWNGGRELGGQALDQLGFLSISTVGICKDRFHFHAGEIFSSRPVEELRSA